MRTYAPPPLSVNCIEPHANIPLNETQDHQQLDPRESNWRRGHHRWCFHGSMTSGDLSFSCSHWDPTADDLDERGSDLHAVGTTSEWSSSLDRHSTPCWPGSRTDFLRRSAPRLFTESPVIMGRPTWERPSGGSRLDWKSTKRPTGRQTRRHQW